MNVHYGSRTIGAHVRAYIEAFGPVPAGREVSHLCDVRNCIEPTHLLAETHKENVARRKEWQLLKTGCPQGHPYDRTTPQGHRRCSICDKAKRAAREFRVV